MLNLSKASHIHTCMEPSDTHNLLLWLKHSPLAFSVAKMPKTEMSSQNVLDPNVHGQNVLNSVGPIIVLALLVV